MIDAILNGDTDLAWGLNATYALPYGAFLQAGLARVDSVDHTLINFGLGYRF